MKATDTDGSTVHAMVKRIPRTGSGTDEFYALGMERVAYCLAEHLGLRVPPVQLGEFEGEPASIHHRLQSFREFNKAQAAPMMFSGVPRTDWPLAVAFDLVLANIDRVDRNLLITPEPPGTRVALASSGKLWLIDHGFAGLYPAAKFGDAFKGKRCDELPDDVAHMLKPFEQRLWNVMPMEFRKSFSGIRVDERRAVLDQLEQLDDDLLRSVVSEVPDDYMNQRERDLTVRLLQTRRDIADKLVEDYWLVA